MMAESGRKKKLELNTAEREQEPSHQPAAAEQHIHEEQLAAVCHPVFTKAPTHRGFDTTGTGYGILYNVTAQIVNNSTS